MIGHLHQSFLSNLYEDGLHDKEMFDERQTNKYSESTVFLTVLYLSECWIRPQFHKSDFIRFSGCHGDGTWSISGDTQSCGQFTVGHLSNVVCDLQNTHGSFLRKNKFQAAEANAKLHLI